MELAEQFVATARRLFETVPGSAAQRSANQWLIGFQASADAWHVALLVLQRTTQSAQNAGGVWQLPPTVLVVTMQLLRFKITNKWEEINEEQRGVVKQTVLAWLREGDATSVSAPAIRVACVIVANLVAKMYAREWPTWHQELQQQLNQQPSPAGIVQLLEIYGAIPAQLQVCVTDAAEVAQLPNAFESHVVEIGRVAREALTIGGSVRECSLRCIEHWGVGCIPACPDMGIDVALLAQSSLLPALLELGLNGEEQAASEIVADVFMSTLSDPLFLSPKIVDAVVHTIICLRSVQQTLLTHGHDESDPSRWQAVSQIVSSVAMHHAAAVFSPEAQSIYAKTRSPSSIQQPISLAMDFLELVLACTSYADAEVAQPTLEFWFFLLDSSAHQGVQLRFLSAAITPEQLVEVLGRLVNALIQQCRYPQRLIDAQVLPSPSHDDPEVETISNLRKEIADTILSLFSKWPTSPTSEHGASCVKGMAALLSSSTDIGTLEAVLFLLEYSIELFDIDSSGSEDEELDDDDGQALQSSNEGAQLLQHILLDGIKLPRHPLLIQGVTRFYQSLTKSLVLPGGVYLQVALKLCEGLDMEVSFSLSAHALIGLSKSIVQYTEVEERRELLEILATKSRKLPSPSTAGGDLLESAFRLTQNLSDSDFTSFCNAVLTPLTEHVGSSDAHVTAVGVSLLGRAIGGVENPTLSMSLSEQVWPLVVKAIAAHNSSASVRESVLQYFSSAVVKNPCASMNRLHEIVSYCLQWFPHSAPVATLHCLSAVMSNVATHDPQFLPVVLKIIETTMTVIIQRLNFDPALDDDVNRKRLDWVFSHEQTTSHLTPEVTELFALLRIVLRFFASSLASDEVLTTLLRVCWLLLDVDHQVQEICDSVCDFVLDTCSSSALLSCSPKISDTLVAACPHLLRAVLAFFGPKRVHYKQRNLWNFVFQLLHAPRIAPSLKGPFHAAMTSLLVGEHVLSPPLSMEQSQSLADALSRTTHRHRFVMLLTQAAKQVEAMSPN